MPPSAQEFARKQDSALATILSGASLSGAIALYGSWPTGIVTPALWTAADISFLVSYDNGATFLPLYSQSAEVKIASAIVSTSEARFFALDPNAFHGVTHLKVQSGVNGTAVTQIAQRLLQVVRTFHLS